MELNANQEEIYDIIMNNEFCYSHYYAGNMSTAIVKAIEMSENYGNHTPLNDEEFEGLKRFLIYEYNETMWGI